MKNIKNTPDKSLSDTPAWVKNLRRLMEAQGYNPRSLSLRAGLNATAVRDMLEGRSRFPRYDTAMALAEALNTTPAVLMSDDVLDAEAAAKGKGFADNLELLTEIIARLQEVCDDMHKDLSPREFAAMAATIYRRLHDDVDSKTKTHMIKPQIIDLLDYDTLRSKKARR